ncbi:MAG: beta-hydroxyacyl-ACP dehydratase [Phycisphaerales bacterium]|nr:beta-hydroxyacyl-ACP dehydratase [Phycisphaerales bacterium]
MYEENGLAELLGNDRAVKFILLDQIVSLEPPTRIVARKSLTLAEEYLADHFPTFPVMPGVLMLEAMVQSAAWLVRASQDFSHSMIVLEEAKNINYKSFVSPGRSLEVTSEAIRIEEATSEFKAFGRSDDEEIVKARLRLRHYNLADANPELADTDEKVTSDLRKKFELLGGPSALKMATAMTSSS